MGFSPLPPILPGREQVPSLMDGGMLWFTDLTVPDPTYALPLIASAIFLLNVELGAADGMQGQPAHVMSRLKTFARIMAVIMVPFTAGMPAVRWRGIMHCPAST